MLSRILPLSIVAFWLTMTALLVRTELHPGASRLTIVPVEHVLKLLFLHEQSSDLNIVSDGQRVGYLRLRPRVEVASGERVLEFIGNLQLRFPQMPKQRFSWDGGFALNHDFELQRVTFGFTMHEPEAYRVDLTIDAGGRLAHVLWKTREEVLEDETFTLDEAGARAAMEHFGMDPMLLRTVGGKNSAKPEVIAQQSSLKMRDEQVETYLIAVRQSGQTLLEIQVSQIGQILAVKTFMGYTLTPDSGEF